jgi:YD repeat-containing protein
VTILTNKLLTQKTDTFYTTTGPYTNIEYYDYNNKDLLTSKSTMSNWFKSTSYTYPSTSANAPEIERRLRSRNMTATVLQQKTRIVPDGTPMDASGYKMDYDAFAFSDTLLLPSRLYRLNANYSGSSFEEVEQVLAYSANGNPLEVVDQSGMHTVYLWGYDDRYLIAEIKNATSSTVNTALRALSNNVEALRTYPSLANSMVTTWTYKPLVGVTSQTDPSGMTTYYDYDGLGRLKEVYRYEGNVVSASNKRILNQYNYHTKAQ